MTVRNMKQKSVSAHDFAMIPRADIPRSSFRMEKMLKTTFSAAYLIPIFCEDVLPGDTFNVKATIVARTPAAVTPVMDNWHMETFFFFVPMRLVWSNWQRFMGEQASPGDSISFIMPHMLCTAGGYAANSIFDYFGLPTAGQITGANAYDHTTLPLRAYNAIYNNWFKDQNLTTAATVRLTDGGDVPGDFTLLKRAKRPDYFTVALPFAQKGTAVSLPLGTTAPVRGISATSTPIWNTTTAGGPGEITKVIRTTAASTAIALGANATNTTDLKWGTGPTDSGLYADLAGATAATINQLRQSFQIQKLLERDARGGTRYTEIVRSHFGVISPDARLQRPEYVGGGRTPVLTTAIPQTSATGLTGGTAPIGTLAAVGHAQGTHGFTYAATEHGYLIGLGNVRADITYQQGLRKMWSRSTRYDFYFPVFAALGEQAVLNQEIYCQGLAADVAVFGYQERWAEYRYNPSQITGFFRSTTAGTLDYWHSAQNFGALPALNNAFISDNSDITLQRNFSAGALTANQQFLCDIAYTMNVARPMPMYSVPGMIDHF